MRIRLTSAVALLAGFGVTVIAYLPALRAGFYFDDLPNIVEFPPVHWETLSLEKITAAAESAPFRSRWVSFLTLALNYRFAELEPMSYHLFNLLIHLAVGGLVSWTAWLLATEGSHRREADHVTCLAAIVPAILFLVHPLNTQAVTYVIQRMTSLAAMFGLLSAGLYISARRLRSQRQSLIFFILSALSWLLAVGSKQNAVIIPVVIATYEICFFGVPFGYLRSEGRSTKIRREPLFLLTALAVAVLFLVLVGYYVKSPLVSLDKNLSHCQCTGIERLLTQPRVHLLYLSLLLWPAPSRLNLDYNFEVSRSLLQPPTTVFAIAFWILVTAGVVYLARKRAHYAFPLFAYLLLHSTESGPVNLDLVFEHRMYFPMAALAWFLTIAAMNVQGYRRTMLLIFLATVILPLAVATYHRNVTWSDPIAFHYDTAAKSPHKYRPQYNLGTELGKQGRYLEAVLALKKAIALNPEASEPHNQLGNVYFLTNQPMKAVAQYREAIRLNDDNAAAVFNLATLLEKTGQYAEAIRLFKRFLEIAPPNLASSRDEAARRIWELSQHKRRDSLQAQ